MRSSIGLWVRADWRRRRVSLLALTLLTGLSFAVVAVAVAGARRTATSFERLRATTLAYDHGVAIDAPGQNPGDGRGYDDATVRRIEQLPQVAAVGQVVAYVARVPGADGELALNAPVGGVIGTQIEHDRILRGRMPAAQSDDEVALSEATAKQTGVDVGGTLTLETMTPDQRIQLMGGDVHALDHGFVGPELQLRVVGVVRGVNDLVGSSDEAAIASPHFDTSYRGRIAYSNRILLVRRASGFTPDDFHAAVDGAVGGAQLGVFDATHEDKPARRTIHTLAVGLVVFALVAGAVSTLAVNQAVSRHVVGSNPAHPALVALGLTRAQRVRAGTVTVVPAAAAGALIATVASYVASPVMPVGLARRVEPDPGLHVDWLVTGLTGLGVVVIVLGEAMIAGLSATRAEVSAPHRSRGSAARVSHLSAAMTATGVGPVAATGMRLAFDRRPPSLPVRSTVMGVGAALAVIVGALTFTSSLDRLENAPHRWGYGWDLLLDTNADGESQLVQALTGDRDVDSVSVVESNFTYIDRDAPLGVRSYGLGTSSGTIGYSLLSGLQPVGPDEVVVGPAMAKRLQLAVGDVTQVATCPCSGDPATTTMTQVRVVGISLFPEDDDGNFNDSLGFSHVGFQRHVGEAAT
ncbi:MAG: putative transport system permease protein, partial [Ilumatobacteraceae bacterium]